jgi:exodeoxyribonuclease-3
MKIASYNANTIGARLPVLLQWLERSRPDVACLQELKAPDEGFPVEALREAGSEAVWRGQKHPSRFGASTPLPVETTCRTTDKRVGEESGLDRRIDGMPVEAPGPAP